jgi:hypothetical protein
MRKGMELRTEGRSMNNRKRANRQSLKAYLANSHKWTATFCKYTDLAKSTLVEVQNVNGAGRVRVPHGWFVSFFMTDEELEKSAKECRDMEKKNRRRYPNPSAPTFAFRQWDVANGKWITETEQ